MGQGRPRHNCRYALALAPPGQGNPVITCGSQDQAQPLGWKRGGARLRLA